MTANHIARMTAKRLMPKFGDDLPFAVEKVIQSDTVEPGQFDLGAVAALAGIATLIVQCAQFAFDWKNRNGGKMDIEALKRELRLELGLPDGVPEKARDEIIDAVAGETEAEE
ncbi:MAG: hypothetical protein ACLPWS_14000 [Rhodomicrobium sp.]